jgi:hypothetical protein
MREEEFNSTKKIYIRKVSTFSYVQKMSQAHDGANGTLYVHMVANGNTSSCKHSYFRRQLGILILILCHTTT